MAQKRKSDGGGLGPHVRALRAGRTDFTPDVLRSVLQWLTMINTRYTEAERTAAGRSDGVNPAIKEGIRRRYSQLASAAQVLMADASCPWSRVAWHRAGRDLDTLLADLARTGDLPPTA